MSQTVVPTFYSAKKRYKEPAKRLKDGEKGSKESVKSLKDVEKGLKEPTKSLNDVEKELKAAQKDSKTTAVVDLSKANKRNAKTKPRDKKVNKITDYLKSDPQASKINKEKGSRKKDETPRTPKRNLTPEEITPSKKRPVVPPDVAASSESTPLKSTPAVLLTPKKKESAARKKLLLNSSSRFGSPKKFGSPVKNGLTPEKIAAYENISTKDLASLVNESRSKILFSGKLDELKKSLESFSNVAAKTKQYQENSFKITSVISSAKASNQEPSAVIKGEPAYKKFSYLAAPKSESSLALPFKYKLLGETFRCLDTVVKIINNRKEKITFEKVKSGVQDMNRKNFSLDHLGQIMTVFPSAYTLVYEKWESYTINKKNSPYHLIITPNLNEVNGSEPETSTKGNKHNSPSGFIYMTPQHLLERKHIFDQNLIKITKTHHQEFLKRKKFPVVPDDKIVRWHPNFPVDSVPNIPVATLPEEPEVKVYTAKDVLDKIKGTFRGRVEKALQSVVDERSESKSSSESVVKKKEENQNQNSALKGICNDLLEKIRARESAKIIEVMTRSAQDEKRLAMLERIPKIVHVLWHYFISERKAAVLVDVAIEKIIHSSESLTTPDAVKEHLELIKETMPGWLSVIKISKGEFITIDKKRDINVMLDNIKRDLK